MTDAPSPAPPVIPAKVDPETLVLRAKASPVIRFKRELIIGLAAVALIVLVATAWFALKPRSLQLVSEGSDLSEPAALAGDTLESLPASYGDAPRLGPPLPGDLGRPILRHQESLSQTPALPQPSPAEQAAAAAREQAEAERRSARQSEVLVTAAVRPPATASATMAQAGAEVPTPQGLATRREAARAGQRPRPDQITNAHAIEPVAARHILSAGSVIAASLITGIRSDLPGLVTAQVTEHVFDTPTGELLLIPQGARLIGTYDSVVAFGQRRALVVWQRIIFPDGQSLRLDDVPAADPGGYAGLEDEVDFHTWTLLKGAVISSLLGVGSSFTFSGERDLVEAIRESTQQNVARAGDQLTSRNLQIRPTITIRPGAPVRLIVHRDLILTPPEDS